MMRMMIMILNQSQHMMREKIIMTKMMMMQNVNNNKSLLKKKKKNFLFIDSMIPAHKYIYAHDEYVCFCMHHNEFKNLNFITNSIYH